jgi:hypothetical protein
LAIGRLKPARTEWYLPERLRSGGRSGGEKPSGVVRYQLQFWLMYFSQLFVLSSSLVILLG